MWSWWDEGKRRVGGFARRHKKLLIVAGVSTACVAGGYYAYRRVVREAQRFGEQLQQQLLQHERLQDALAKTDNESRAAIQRFLLNLRKHLYDRVDLDAIVAQLRQLDRHKDKDKRQELWEQAKLTGLTRLFVGVYAYALLHLLVFVQLSIVAKQTFDVALDKKANVLPAEQLEDEEVDDKETKQTNEQLAAKSEFLNSGINFFLQEGLVRLQEHVEQTLQQHEALESDWQVRKKTQVEADELNQLLESIHQSFVPANSAECVLWRSFVIYPEKREGQSEQVISLLNDMWDLLESELFSNALHEALNFSFKSAVNDLTGSLYDPVPEPEQVQEATDADTHEDPKQKPQVVPLAKVIPQWKHVVERLLNTPSTSQRLSSLDHFRDFSQAVFFQQDGALLDEWQVI